MPTYSISLIATVYNEEATIGEFLESYRQQTLHADEFVVVDGGSSDSTARIIAEFARAHSVLNLRLLIEPSCSRRHTAGAIAAGRNAAIAATKNDIIAVTDAGCILDRRWLEEIVVPFRDEQVEVVSGWYEPLVEESFQSVYAAIAMPGLETIDPDKFLPSSRSIAFRKRCWLAVGGYPTATYTAEDTMFDMAMQRQGFRFTFVPAARVYWRCPATMEEALAKHYRYAFGDGQYRLLLGFYLLKCILLLFPITFLLDGRRRPHFFACWRLLLVSQWGYFRGILVGIGTPRGRGKSAQ